MLAIKKKKKKKNREGREGIRYEKRLVFLALAEIQSCTSIFRRNRDPWVNAPRILGIETRAIRKRASGFGTPSRSFSTVPSYTCVPRTSILGAYPGDKFQEFSELLYVRAVPYVRLLSMRK